MRRGRLTKGLAGTSGGAVIEREEPADEKTVRDAALVIERSRAQWMACIIPNRKDQRMTGEELLHQFFEEAHVWLEDGGVHYRPCPHRGQPHYRPDEPCVWMAPEATRAFLAWAVQKGHAVPSWAQACLRRGLPQEVSPLADVAANMRLVQPDRLRALVESIRRSPLPALLVGLGLGLLLGQRYRRSR